MKTANTLDDLRSQIEDQAPYVDIRSHSHNILGIVLSQIAGSFGEGEANRAIRDFGLEAKGWSQHGTTVETSDKAALTQAFKLLRKQGYTARQNFSCCSGCAWSELIQVDKGSLCVFYNRQSDDAWTAGRGRRKVRSTMLQHPLFLQWAGDVALIIEVLRSTGLRVADHDGAETMAVEVLPKEEVAA